MADKTIKQSTGLQGKVVLPGDKSISHRSLICSAISDGTCTISGLSPAQDVSTTAQCLKKLGVKIVKSKAKVKVHGVGMKGLKQPANTLDAGNSGTTIRLLTGILAAQDFDTRITGDDSLRNRPMRRIIDPLEKMGGEIESENHKAPLMIKGRSLRAIDYASPIASAQVKSCVLLAGLYARGLTRVTEPYPSRDHTERMLETMQVNVHYSEAMGAVKGPAQIKAVDFDIPADISAAAFFLVAAALVPDSKLTMENVGANPTRTGILDALSSMGARVSILRAGDVNNEERVSLTMQTSSLKSTTLGGSMIPRIIDEIPIFAVAATQAEGVTTIKNAHELRVKESDRLSSIATNLKKMGAKVREKDDGLVITGPTPLKGATVDSFGDHRIAMAFTIAGLIAEGETTIQNIDCVGISFPDFFDTVESIQHD